jgi:cytochrome P450
VTVTDDPHPRADGWRSLHYDHRASKVAVDPWDLWRRMRDQCPVLWSDRYDGFWFVSRHEDVNRVLVDWEHFTAAEGTNIPKQAMRMLPLEIDPPEHRQYRAILNPALAPQRVAPQEGWIRDEARRRLAALAGRTTLDVATEFAEPFAKTVALRVIGFELDDLPRLEHWTHILSVGTRDDEEGLTAGMEFFGYLAETLAARSVEEPRDDLISLIVNGSVDGRALSPEEQLSMLLLLAFGGLHTTGQVIAGALVWLADHPEDRVRLRAEPELMPTAIDEFVRYVSPVTHMSRTAAADTELAGCPIRAGERVMFGIGSANHDERVFERAEDVVLDRHPNLHFGFGAGPHRCVGSHLGKLAVRVALEEFLAAFTDFEVTDHHLLRWAGGEGRHLESAPLTMIAEEGS